VKDSADLLQEMSYLEQLTKNRQNTPGQGTAKLEQWMASLLQDYKQVSADTEIFTILWVQEI